MAYKVFIDGRHGTTGLKIDERLSGREEIELLSISEEQRKDPAAKAEFINGADIVFLCLPDDASRESVALLEPGNTNTRFLDASTAHRIDHDWAYGLPELSPQHRENIRNARKVAIPGCHASGFILLIQPLVAAGIIPADFPITTYSVTGYTGGGKQMIASYEEDIANLPDAMKSPRLYGLTLSHKHLPEMQVISGLAQKPLFTPIVGNFAQGMVVAVPLIPSLLNQTATPRGLHDFYSTHYRDQTFVKVMPREDSALDKGFLPATACNGTNRAEIFVFGHEDQILLACRLDNLGKGASGAGVQCMNIMLGLPEDAGLSA